MASLSMKYTIRQWCVSSLMRNSAQRVPMLGMGRDCGNPIVWPTCKRLSSKPASIRAALENGGVLISPCSQTIGFGPVSGFGCTH